MTYQLIFRKPSISKSDLVNRKVNGILTAKGVTEPSKDLKSGPMEKIEIEVINRYAGANRNDKLTNHSEYAIF